VKAAARGFTVVELLIASIVVLTVGGAALALVAPLGALTEAGSGSVDLSQRLRTGTDAITADVARAGSGLMIGGEQGGLGAMMPVVVPDVLPRPGSPREIGWQAATLGLLHVPLTAAQARLASPAPGPLDPLPLQPTPFCGGTLASCGFSAGLPVAIVGPGGRWELVTVSAVEEPTRSLRHDASPLTHRYEAGALVVHVAPRSYALRGDAASGAWVLTREQDGGVAQPVLDHVVGFTVEFFGDAEPPRAWTTGADGQVSTSYGPAPPPLDSPPGGTWPAGENCVFTRAADGSVSSRLAALPPGRGRVLLSPDILGDGPWCPDVTAALRYDADLLRIRHVTVRLRVQVASAALRGVAGPLFSRGGTGRARVLVPDREVLVTVSPLSLPGGR
jgi:hypothetical protein